MRYGHPYELPAGLFSEAWYQQLRAKGTQPQLSGIAASPFHRTRHPYNLLPGHPPPGLPNLLRPPSVQRSQGGAGILTCLPSPTPFGLSLGTGSPWEDKLDPGNLGLTARGFLTPFIATHSGISTPKALSWPFRSSSYLLWDAPLPPITPDVMDPKLRHQT